MVWLRHEGYLRADRERTDTVARAGHSCWRTKDRACSYDRDYQCRVGSGDGWGRDAHQADNCDDRNDQSLNRFICRPYFRSAGRLPSGAGEQLNHRIGDGRGSHVAGRNERSCARRVASARAKSSRILGHVSLRILSGLAMSRSAFGRSRWLWPARGTQGGGPNGTFRP
jgi:hypothetical protein